MGVGMRIAHNKITLCIVMGLTHTTFTSTTEEWRPRMPEDKKQAEESIRSLTQEISKQEEELQKLREKKRENSAEYKETEEKLLEKRIDLHSAEIADRYFNNQISRTAYEQRQQELQDPQKLIATELAKYQQEIEQSTNPSGTDDNDIQQQELSQLAKLKLQAQAFFKEKQARWYDFFNNQDKVARTMRNLVEIYTALNDPQSITTLIDKYGMNLPTLTFLLMQDKIALEKLAANPQQIDTEKGSAQLASLLVDLLHLRNYAKGNDEISKKLRNWIDDTLSEFRTSFDLPTDLEKSINNTITQPTLFQINIKPSTSFEFLTRQIEQSIQDNTQAILDRIEYPERSIAGYQYNLEQLAESIQAYAQNPPRPLSAESHLKLNYLTDKIYESLFKAVWKRYEILDTLKGKRRLTSAETKSLQEARKQSIQYIGKRLSAERQVEIAEDRILAAQEGAESIKAQKEALEKQYEAAPRLSFNAQQSIKTAFETAAQQLTDMLLLKTAPTPEALQKAFSNFREILEGYRTLIAHMPTTNQDVLTLGQDISALGNHIWRLSLNAFNTDLSQANLKVINDALEPLEKVILELNALNTYHFNQLTPVIRDDEGKFVTTVLEKTVLDHPYANSGNVKTQSVQLDTIVNDIRQRAAHNLSEEPAALKAGTAQTLLQKLDNATQQELKDILALPLVKLPTQLLQNMRSTGE
jgi:chromosome segregation ATPase